MLRPGQPVEILLNDEAELVASIRSNRDIGYGELVLLADVDEISELRPADVDEEAGWVAFVSLPGGRHLIAFDFRRNRGRGRDRSRPQSPCDPMGGSRSVGLLVRRMSRIGGFSRSSRRA